jgi:hypothetical protein
MFEPLRNLFHRREQTQPIESIMFLHRWKEWPGPFHVWSHEPAAKCVRLKDGRLHVYQRGSFPNLLDGTEYILASRNFANALRDACDSSVEIVPAQVINAATGETLAKHFEVLPCEEVTLETLATVTTSGSRAWHFNKSHLFVTKQVVLDLHGAGFTSLEFSPGFSAFCGGVTAE